MNEPLFSVIISVFNEEKNISRAINSVLNQNFKNIEIVIIDDCSTDKTGKIIDNFNNIIKVKILKNNKNIGLGASRNRGIEISSGKYLFFLDADDYLLDNYFFNDLAELIIKQDPDIIITPYIREINGKYRYDEYSKDIIFFNYTNIDKYKSVQMYISRDLATHGSCAKAIKKDLFLFSKFTQVGFSEDVNCIFNLLFRSKNVVVSKRYGYVYVRNFGSITQNSDINIYKAFTALRIITDIFTSSVTFYVEGFEVNLKKFIDIWMVEQFCNVEKYLLMNKQNIFNIFYKFRGLFLWLFNDNEKIKKILYKTKKISKNMINKDYHGLIDYINDLRLISQIEKKLIVFIVSSKEVLTEIKNIDKFFLRNLRNGYNTVLITDYRYIDTEYKDKIFYIDELSLKLVYYLSVSEKIFISKFFKKNFFHPSTLICYDNFYYKIFPFTNF